MLSLSLVLVLVVVCALAFDYINGFHDTANAIATVVSTRVLSPRKAIVMAACLNFVGALVSTQVAITVASGLVDTARFQIVDIHQPAAFAAKLKSPADPLSQYLATRLSPVTQELLGQYPLGCAPPQELQEAIVADLNRIITRADLYSAERFAGIALAFSAGTFLHVSLSDLLPHVHEHAEKRLPVALAFLVGVGAMIALEKVLQHSGHHF